VLVAVIAFAQAGGDSGSRLFSAFDWSSPAGAGAVPPRLDAWVTPPPYTGRPPIFLTAGTAEAGVGDEQARLSVPAGSVLVVRSSGFDPRMSVEGGARGLDGSEEAATAPAPRRDTASGDQLPEHRYVLESDAAVTAHPRFGDSRSWRFAVVADTAPRIAFQAPPRADERGALVLDYRVDDDYGVTEARADSVRPAERSRPKVPEPRPLYEAPEIRLVLPQGRTRSGAAITTFSAIEHPWAGARVQMTLVARDEAGQEGRSDTVEAVLPARAFSDPLARALVEQRRELALDARARDRVAGALDALALFPDRFAAKSGIYLGLRAAYWRVSQAKTDDDLKGAADYLWEMALAIEEGDLPGLQQSLQDAAQALREALDRNAPDEEIRQLMDQLRAALDQFLREFARRAEQNPQQNAQIPPDARVMTEQDMKNMLDQLEQLARGDNKQAAKDMLSQLSEMLKNLQNGQMAQGQPQSGDDAASRALDELGRMIREQSELRDRTFQQGQQQPGQQGQQGQQGEGQQGMGELGEQQRDLQQRLQELMRGMEGEGLEGEQGLGDAGEAMGRAQGRLGQGDAPGAVGQQGRALEALRRGAQSMAEKMQQSEGEGQGQAQGQPGRRGQAANGRDTDPLGRPTRNPRYDPGASVRVPGEIEAQRARRVLEELRRRVGEPGRPQDEIDYLERLLRE
jgi:uncharacterized protein (TIGR02302 family)